MLTFDHVTLRRGPRLLFQEVSFTIYAGQKVGVTGANGSGKSSLFALVRGELHPDAGHCGLPPTWVIAHVAQETPAVETPAIDYVMAGDRELEAIRRALAEAEQADDGARQAALHTRLEAIHGYTARVRAARLMHGLGFAPGQEDWPVRTFSGGWRVRLNLAQALMARSDLLLLDEPTNHLDLDAVIWLEDWLRTYPGTLLLISHDRDFLDRVVDHVAHIERGAIRLYDGNYSTFERRRAEHLARQQAVYDKQQREIAHIHRFVERFRAKATKARQAQSRLHALARLERIAPAHVDSPFRFAFRPADRVPMPLLRLEQVQAGYDGQTVLSRIGIGLVPGDRIGLLGPNGAGKSTLVRLLAGELMPLAGRREAAADLRIGYFAQHQLEQLRAEDSPLLHLQRLDSKATEQALRDFLGGFGFSGDMALAPVAPLSGGEKARLVLALIVYQRPNLLLLDEPTNHLDLEMRHALSLALQEFEGAMVVVSHDRHLLRTVTDTLWLVADGRVQPFDGDLDDYRRWLIERRESEREELKRPSSADSATARRERRRDEAETRRRLQPLRAEVRRLEERIAQLSAERIEVEQRLAEPSLYAQGNTSLVTELLQAQARLTEALAQAEAAWLETCEALEAAAQRE